MRCITAEEREILGAAAKPLSLRQPRSMTPREHAITDRLTASGCVTEVPYAFGWLVVATPRDRLALACHAAVNARMA